MNSGVFLFDDKTHTYTLDGRVLPSITGILKATGWIDDEWFTDEGRTRGQVVHRACWYLAEGDLDWKDFETRFPLYLGYVKAFDKFQKESGFKQVWCERPLYSRGYWFAGTPDLYGMMRRSSVIDIKTGECGLAARIQTAGQRVLIRENYQDSPDRFALQLTRDGKYNLISYNKTENFEDERIFLNQTYTVNFRRNCGNEN